MSLRAPAGLVVLLILAIVACDSSDPQLPAATAATPPAAPTPATVRNPEPARGLDRTVLPIAAPEYAPITELDARNATAPPRSEVTSELN
jgi:hypothetical protein